MKLLLVGIYIDGSNARHLTENPLLEYAIGNNVGEHLLENALFALKAAKMACENTHGSFSEYVIILDPEARVIVNGGGGE